ATSPASSTCPGTATPRRSGCAPRRSCAARSAARRSTTARWWATRRWPVCTSWCTPPPGGPLAPVNQAALQASIAAAVRSWDDDLAAEAQRQLGPERAVAVLRSCANSIPQTYKADTVAADAVADLAIVQGLREEAAPFAIRLSTNQNECSRLRVYRLSPLTLSDVLPQLQHMGLEVLDEHPYEFGGTTDPFWIYDFGIRGSQRTETATETDHMRAEFEAALTALWHGQTEDDDFNGLVLNAELTWRQVVVLRAYARYLRQVGIQFSQSYLQRVLRAN